MRTLKRLMRFAVPYWKIYVVTFVLVFGITGMAPVQPLIVRWIVDGFSETRLGTTCFGSLAHGRHRTLGGRSRLRSTLRDVLGGQRIIFDIRNRLYEHLQQLSFSFTTRPRRAADVGLPPMLSRHGTSLPTRSSGLWQRRSGLRIRRTHASLD